MVSSSKAGRGARQGLRSPHVRIVAGAVVAAVAVSSFAFNGTSAGAATLPNSQSVGNFLDGTLGSSALESVVKLQDATAVNPGSTSVQNPLKATLLNQISLPLTGALQLPPTAGITLGAVNQVAVADADGYSYGASGAVNNSGGVSVGGNNAAYPAAAHIDLTGGSSAANPLSGLNQVADLTADIGAVSALATTPAGKGKAGTTQYNIAGVSLNFDSPVLAKVLSPLLTAVGSTLTALDKALGLKDLPTSCVLNNGQLPTISLLGGAITLNLEDASFSIDLAKVLQLLNLNLNSLPANTDLLDELITYLGSPAGLAAGLNNALSDLQNTLSTTLSSCASGLGAISGIAGLLNTLLTTLSGALGSINTALSGLTGALDKVLGSNALEPLIKVVKSLIDIGVNVQPNGPAGTYTDALKATADQTTTPVAGQTVVRAIEVNLLGHGVNLALGNAAAGPSNPAAAASSTPAGPTSSNVPTGVPAGFGTKGGTPALPIVLLVLGLMIAGGGVTAQRLRARRGH